MSKFGVSTMTLVEMRAQRDAEDLRWACRWALEHEPGVASKYRWIGLSSKATALARWGWLRSW